MIPIPVVGGRALVFEIEHVKALRELGVVGVLSGTLPMAAQQNVFLGLPLQLMKEEVRWLVESRNAYLVPSETFYKTLMASLTEQDVAGLQEQRRGEFARQRAEKEQEQADKLARLKITPKRHSGSSASLVYFYEIPNDSREIFATYTTFQEYYKREELQAKLVAEFVGVDSPQETLHYKAYCALRERDYCVLPGLRFGGKYIAYPGDPLLYHSHAIVNAKDYCDEDIGLRSIVNGGRLATATKKMWVVAGEAEEGMKFFSIDWAGFG